ncbi:hypothetical protein B0H11DRAFT_76406 [Mycena galericulata]|nr:hypothetical protein B0H11DRAFT_76406 [Mycena galericulata]
MRFSTFALFASSLASSLAAPAPQTTTPTAASLVSNVSTVITQLTRLNTVGAQIATTPSSAPEINGAIQHINRVVSTLVPVEGSGGLLGGLLGGLGDCGLGQIMSGNGDVLSGLLSGDPLGDLLCGTNGGGILSGLLGGDLLSGLLDGLLGGVLGGGGGGLLGGLLGGGDGGLLASISGLLNLFPGLGSSCGTDLVSELLDIVESLVGSLTSLLTDGQNCGCGDDEVLRARVASMIKANEGQLAPIPTH